MHKEFGMHHDVTPCELSDADRKQVLHGLPYGMPWPLPRQLFAHILYLEERMRRYERMCPNARPFKKRDGHLYYCEQCRKARGWGGNAHEGHGLCEMCGKAETWVYGKDYR